ncbi:uncharacterized protein LOC126738440 isoform X2 [Anthonomus grandis grandis]|uniref:uncharacterized protein LOC126738440 isoform X2 n=1 Tax=Anthonomus grandis grandis TaxID=2921223 RepID=UPI0021665BA0|nr:uncharacterized protein LOC126738440 isoform X2 [Anthonomus grandis grandis]
MGNVDDYFKEIICLQLKKPKSWNWELKTSKSSPNIALPCIKLFDAKGRLLVESKSEGGVFRSSDVTRTKPIHSNHRRTKSDDISKDLQINSISKSHSDVKINILKPKDEKNLNKKAEIDLQKSNNVDSKRARRPYLGKSNSDMKILERIQEAKEPAPMRSRHYSFGHHHRQLKKNDETNNEKKNQKPKIILQKADVVSFPPNKLQVEDVPKPKRYRLRKSRAGTLLINDESFSSTHRKRCHGEFGDCRHDSDDIIIENIEDLSDSAEEENINRGEIQLSDKEKQSKADYNGNYIIKSNSYIENHNVELVNDKRRRRKKRVKKASNQRRTFSSSPQSTEDDDDESDDKDLTRLVRQLSLPKITELPSQSQKFRNSYLRNCKSEKAVHRISESRHRSRIENHVNGKGMGANVSRHSAKGLTGRRSQSSGNICNGKGGSGRHQGDGSGSDGGGGDGISGSLPNYLDGGGGSINNYQLDDEDDDDEDNDEEKLNSQCQRRIPPLGDGAPLHWKFSDSQTPQHCHQDQGYGSERSQEEEYPPPPPTSESGHHDVMNQCHHHLEAHSCYPFITPESTFTVKLNKGPRGLGLSVTGGIESVGSWPGLVRVKRLFPHQPASACGLLNVGDLLLEVNGIPLTGLTNYEALEVLRTASNQVELKISRPPPDVLNCVSPISEVPPPPPTRKEPPNTLNFCSSYYGATPEDEFYHGEFEVTLTKMQGSLGFTLRKEDDSPLGHYVRALVREPALTDGRIKAGDKIIAVNDIEIFQMTHEEAVQYLRQCGDKVKLRLYRDLAQTPVTALSPSPRASCSRKTHLRQEALDMLTDIAGRKAVSLPERPRFSKHQHQHFPEDGTKYIVSDEQFHEGMLKCKHFDENEFDSLFVVDGDDDGDRPSRPNSLDLYNPNQTPVAGRKPRFTFSLAHNAYELNNLDPEVLDAPNLTYNLGTERDSTIPEGGNDYPKEPASMPHIPVDNNSSLAFSNKTPAYQSAHFVLEESDSKSNTNHQHNHQQQQQQQAHHNEETDTIKRKKGILKKDSTNRDNKADATKCSVAPMEEEFEILAIEMNRGWNSRLGFSLQGAAGVTYVSAVYAGSVAARDGRIKPGDRIIKVNDEDVEHMQTNEIIDLLRIVRGPVCIFVKRIKSKEDCPNKKSNAEN